MRVAILSDIHGNKIGLDAVLADIASHNVDEYWFLGDYCSEGTHPAEVLETMMALPGLTMIYGNAEQKLLNPTMPSAKKLARMVDKGAIKDILEEWNTTSWTIGALAEGKWLKKIAELAMEYRTELPDGTSVLLVHASPGTAKGQGLTPDLSDDEVWDLFGMAEEDLIFVGHKHAVQERHINGKHIFNPGSIGKPVGTDVRASYAILDADEQGYSISAHYVEYDTEACIRQLKTRHYPDASDLKKRFKGKYVPAWERKKATDELISEEPIDNPIPTEKSLSMKKLTQIIGIILINVLIIAILLEILLRVFAPNLPGSVGVAARWVTTGQPYQEEWTQAWEQSIEHYWTLRPGIDNALQYGSPTVSFNMSTIELWENSGIGFRTDPVDYFVDAVVLGDSFAMCFTERQDCWVEQFANQSNYGVVNLGQPVTGTRSHLRILQDFGVFLLADNPEPLVIWQFFGNDFNDDYGLAVFRDEIEPLESESAQDTEVRQWSALIAVAQTLFTGQFVGVPDSEALFVKPYRATYGDGNVLQFGGEYELNALDMSRELNQIGYDYSVEAFREAKSIVEDMNGELLIVIIPTREEVYRDITIPIMGEESVDRLQSARDAMLALCEELSLNCFDAYDVFVDHANNGEALYFSDDMHLNPYGNQILAEALATYLQN